jgi:hypothetical protein
MLKAYYNHVITYDKFGKEFPKNNNNKNFACMVIETLAVSLAITVKIYPIAVDKLRLRKL